MKKRRRRHNTPPLAVFAIPAAVLAAAGLIFASVQSFSHREDPCAENVARLQALENADISQTEKELAALITPDPEQKLSDVRKSITESGEVLSDIEIKQAFQGTVILGDSITESIMEYGFLNTDVVISKRGLSVAFADEQFETAIGLHPSTIFTTFGANDLEIYESDASAFKESYRKQIQKLKDALPDTPIYINCILPILPSTIEQVPALGYYPEYNQVLKELCEEMDCTFIDSAFIIENDESMYEPDGEHVVRDFYPKWLTFMAESAGL